jgi:4-diphosphocytidyl-2-C-methyl-D-erythritol kinase
VRARAHAKINWTLEVLGKRPDGFHEVRSILQTISLADTITLRDSDECTLSIRGDDRLAAEPGDTNLALQAARLLQRHTGRADGAAIEIDKRVPTASGMGGGSSDAAAVLRGLRFFWDLSLDDDELSKLGAELGSDVPFFVRGGTALASGRGEHLEQLRDVGLQHLVVAWPTVPPTREKTASMYAALERFDAGGRTAALGAKIEQGRLPRDDDLYNAFEEALAGCNPPARQAFDDAALLGMGQPHLCGAGPGFFFLRGERSDAATISRGLDGLGLRTAGVHTVPASEAQAVVRVS